MENDQSAMTFDMICRQSRQFGFFQKRLFLVNILIQSACISVLLYTSISMPEVPTPKECEPAKNPQFVVAFNGHHYPTNDNSSEEVSAEKVSSEISSENESSKKASSEKLSSTVSSEMVSSENLLDVTPEELSAEKAPAKISLAMVPSEKISSENVSLGTSSEKVSSGLILTNISFEKVSSGHTTQSIPVISPTSSDFNLPLPSNESVLSGIDKDIFNSSSTEEYFISKYRHQSVENFTSHGLEEFTVNISTNVASTRVSEKDEIRPGFRLDPMDTSVFLKGSESSDLYTTPAFDFRSHTEDSSSSLVSTETKSTESFVLSKGSSEIASVTESLLTNDVFQTTFRSTQTTTEESTSPTPSLTSEFNVTSSLSPSVTTVAPCPSEFFLINHELDKTEILGSFELHELRMVTFYAQGSGVIVGALVGSMIADIYGRRRLLFVSLSAMLVFHCLVAFSISWLLFIFLRMVTVGFCGATLVISFVMVIEYLGPDWRDVCTCSCLWTFGAIVVSMETIVTSHWRWFALLSGAICLPLVGTFFTSHESVRWLQCQHRFTEAEGGFREVISVNSAAVPNIMALLDQSRACIVNNMHPKKFTFFDLFHSLDSTKWTVALVYTCLISSCVYFCLLWRVRHITGNPYVDGFLPYLIDLPLTWSAIVVNRCLGRRWCLFLYSVASGFALLSVLVLHVTGNLIYMPSLVTGLALFGKIGVSASGSLLFLIAIEMYPTVTRCMGVAVAVASASGGAMLSTALVFLDEYHYTVPFLVYGAMMASTGIVGLVFPETMRRPLINVQQCRHRKIPLTEGHRLVSRVPNLWDSV